MLLPFPFQKANRAAWYHGRGERPRWQASTTTARKRCFGSGSNFWDRSKHIVRKGKSQLEEGIGGVKKALKDADRRQQEAVERVGKLRKETVETTEKIQTSAKRVLERVGEAKEALRGVDLKHQEAVKKASKLTRETRESTEKMFESGKSKLESLQSFGENVKVSEAVQGARSKAADAASSVRSTIEAPKRIANTKVIPSVKKGLRRAQFFVLSVVFLGTLGWGLGREIGKGIVKEASSVLSSNLPMGDGRVVPSGGGEEGETEP